MADISVFEGVNFSKPGICFLCARDWFQIVSKGAVSTPLELADGVLTNNLNSAFLPHLRFFTSVPVLTPSPTNSPETLINLH